MKKTEVSLEKKYEVLVNEYEPVVKETLELREKLAKMEAHYTNIIIGRNAREIELEGALKRAEGLISKAEKKLTEEVEKRKTLLGRLKAKAPEMLLEVLIEAA